MMNLSLNIKRLSSHVSVRLSPKTFQEHSSLFPHRPPSSSLSKQVWHIKQKSQWLVRGPRGSLLRVRVEDGLRVISSSNLSKDGRRVRNGSGRIDEV